MPLYARRASLEELSADLATALDIPSADLDDLLTALGARTQPVTIIVDALDEAGTSGDGREGMRIARELLQPLTTLSAVRLIVGTRCPLVAILGHGTEVLDLDSPDHISAADITAYAAACCSPKRTPAAVLPTATGRNWPTRWPAA